MYEDIPSFTLTHLGTHSLKLHLALIYFTQYTHHSTQIPYMDTYNAHADIRYPLLSRSSDTLGLGMEILRNGAGMDT